MIILLSGPMTGCQDFNKPEFFKAASLLHEAGHIVLNPAVYPEGLTHGQYMHMCLPMVEVADGIYQLPRWEYSKGALIEYQHAKQKRKLIFDSERLTQYDRKLLFPAMCRE